MTICGGEVIGSVAVLPIDETTDWSADDDGRPVLSLSVAAPGDFSIYTLTIDSSALDPYFDAVLFSFKANCPSDLDCATPDPSCPPFDDEPVPINYLAKDFASFTQALSDFSALRYPFWVERSEADVGVMVMEALSAVADELSYLQDRVSAEATLETATQRVSLLRHARLVDYEPAPAIAATTKLQLDVADGVTSIAAGPSMQRARRRRPARPVRGRRAAGRPEDGRADRRDVPGRPALERRVPGLRGTSTRTGGTTAANACRRARRACG